MCYSGDELKYIDPLNPYWVNVYSKEEFGNMLTPNAHGLFITTPVAARVKVLSNSR